MKTLALAFFLFLNLQFTAQDDLSFEVSYEITQVYEPLSLNMTEVENAESLADLHRFYKPEWVKEFHNVEISGVVDGNLKSATSKSDKLTDEQKKLINKADFGTYLNVRIDYLPENTLKNNEPKVFDFSFRVNPEQEASFKEGELALKEYLNENVIEKIPTTYFEEHNITAVNFTVDTRGKVVDAYIVDAPRTEAIEEMLLESVCNMPDWIAAEYADGTKVDQDFVLMAGDKRSCAVNLLNIRR